MRVIVSDSHDVRVNLALEQELMNERGSEEFVMLYRNERSVVVGRNQVIEAEVDIDFCLNNFIPVVKRKSGGGTVWHDMGNVNYSFVLNRGDGSPLDSDFTAPIRAALESLGLSVRRDARNALFVGDCKISGTAAMFTRERVLFHGTLLFDSDLATLEQACRGDNEVKAAVRSVHDKVGNISAMLPSRLSVEEFVGRLAEFLSEYR